VRGLECNSPGPGRHLVDRPGHEKLLAFLSSEIDRVLGTLLPRGSKVALLNFPNHRNPGDAAIWLGEREALTRLGLQIVYTATAASYKREVLARVIDDGTILFHGGGNIGDLYPLGQAATREQVLQDFRATPTIQLPQSIWFNEQQNLDRWRTICHAHSDFTLLLRENQSLSYSKLHFDLPSVLCPDMAFALGSLPQPIPASDKEVWLLRTDLEADAAIVAGRSELPKTESVMMIDWGLRVPWEPRPAWTTRGLFSCNQRLVELMRTDSIIARPCGRLLSLTFYPLARHWVARGCRLLSQGRVVVTDRLHGHILSLLIGLPHVLLDNTTGKCRSTYDTWTRHSSLVRWADNLPDARSLVQLPDQRARSPQSKDS
jgi:pyruvyl transferase EpsO